MGASTPSATSTLRSGDSNKSFAKDAGDPDGGTELGSVVIAGNPDAIRFNPVSNHVYLAIGKPGVVQVVAARSMAVVETVETRPGAPTLALDARRQELYVFCPPICSLRAYTVSPS